MQTAYDSAFAGYLRCHELLHEERWANFRHDPSDWLLSLAEGEDKIPDEPSEPMMDFHYEAQVEDTLADHFASVVLLFADDALQCFARGVLGEKNHRSLDGYGPTYPDAKNHSGTVALTTLLRAGTNAIRHVSEWDTPSFPFPYPAMPHCKKTRTCAICQALPSIDVIQRVFGLGIHERIRDPVSMRVLIRVDGHLGSPGSVPSYHRFEEAVLSAATQIAAKSGEAASQRLQAAFAQNGKR